MKVKWKQFAQRRNLNLSVFKDSNYEAYSRWCEVRSVEPETRSSFEDMKNIFERTEDIEIAVENKESIIFKNVYVHQDLKKLRKSDIVVLCKKENIELQYKSKTKNYLISLLINLNKLKI